MKSKNYKIKIHTILGFCITFLFIFTINIKAQIQEELNLELQKQVLNEIEITGRFSNNTKITKSGEPITFILTIKNNSKSPIYFVESSATRDYKIIVRNHHNETISLTEYGKRQTDPYSPIWRNFVAKLEPGKSRESRIGLDKLFNITPEGKYFISLSRIVTVNRIVDANRIVQEQGNWVRITSKEIQFTVN